MSLLHSSFYVKNDIIKQNLFDENLRISSDYKQMLDFKNYRFSYIPESLSNVSMGGRSLICYFPPNVVFNSNKRI